MVEKRSQYYKYLKVGNDFATAATSDLSRLKGKTKLDQCVGGSVQNSVQFIRVNPNHVGLCPQDIDDQPLVSQIRIAECHSRLSPRNTTDARLYPERRY